MWYNRRGENCFFKFGFIGLFRAPPAKEIEGLGQLSPFTSNHLTRGGGKKLRRPRWFFPPLPRNALGYMKKPRVSETFQFKTLSCAVAGRGAGAISNAEVSRPLSQGRQAFAFGCCCPIPHPPWLGFIACKPQFEDFKLPISHSKRESHRNSLGTVFDFTRPARWKRYPWHLPTEPR